eukprot:299638_1
MAEIIKTFQILNVDKNESTISIEDVALKKKVDTESYVISDADEELLILVEFKDIINLETITIFSLSQNNSNHDISPPKQVDVYKMKNLNISFADLTSLKPDKSIICSLKKLHKGQNIKLKKTIKFKQTRYLAVYIKSNQNDAENTYINSIQFKQSQGFRQIDPSNTKEDCKLETTESIDIENMLQQQVNVLSDIRSNYLFEFNDIYGRNKSHDFCHKSTECTHLQRIRSILIKYNSYITDKRQYNKNINMDNIYNHIMNYSNNDLLNDYHHLLYEHSNEFEDIYNVLNGSNNACDISECLILRRNHRYRSISSSYIISQLYFKEDDHGIIRQQLIDRIHSYYFHSFDTGYKLTRQERECISESDST